MNCRQAFTARQPAGMLATVVTCVTERCDRQRSRIDLQAIMDLCYGTFR